MKFVILLICICFGIFVNSSIASGNNERDKQLIQDYSIDKTVTVIDFCEE